MTIIGWYQWPLSIFNENGMSDYESGKLLFIVTYNTEEASVVIQLILNEIQCLNLYQCNK